MIGVPLDFGASRRGVEMGPAALRIARMAESLRSLGHTVTDIGDVTVPQRATIADEAASHGFLPLITDVCEELADETADAVAHGAVPLVLGGDHSLVAGSLAGAARHFATRGEVVGCVYLDTHADLNVPETSDTATSTACPSPTCSATATAGSRPSPARRPRSRRRASRSWGSASSTRPSAPRSASGGSPASRCARSTRSACAR